MGEVWKARDSRLGREVALKILPDELARDPERLQRFEREAQLLAALNHPHIAAIYGIEESGPTKALVLELVEGPTLHERLEHGALPVEEALRIARQVAEALEAAHDRGVIHRDLKPQNVKLTADGEVKVLDFGLAKALDPAAAGSPTASPALMNSPTLTAAGTQIGVILGTAAYMSPEQAKGLTVDKRADIWSFGALLYEMLGGQRLFPGDSVPETLASVLKSEIDLAALPQSTPGAVRRLLERCLDRNPKTRLRDIGEARVALEPRALGDADARAVPAVSERRRRWRSVLPWVLVALLALALPWTLRRGTAIRDDTAERSPILAINLPAGISIPLDDRGIYGQTGVLAIAPDGSRVAFVEINGNSSLYVRDLDRDSPRQLEDTAGASSPFFSPDGRWVAFFSPGRLRKAPIAGGRPVDLAEAALDRGGAWCPDGSIVFTPSATSGLFLLPAQGGAPRPLTQLDVEHGERTHRWPAVLPGGREVAFTVGRNDQPGNYEDSRIDVVELATGKRRPLLQGASMVRFTPDGVALLARQGQVLAVPASRLDGGRVEDAPRVLSQVAGVAASGVSHFDVAQDGTLVYAERDPQAAELQLAWLSPTGEETPVPLPKAEYRQVRLSPDNRFAALGVGPGGGTGGDVWVYDIARNTVTKLTLGGKSWAPIWSRDGKRITFVAQEENGGEVFLERPADGSVAARVVVAFETGHARAPIAWTPDGSLLFWEDGGAGSAGDILYLPPGGGEPRPIAATPAIEITPSLSPDGRFVAYGVDEIGAPEIRVQPFPPTGATWVLAENGRVPHWSRDGSQIYYTIGRQFTAVPVSTTGAFSAGVPRPLFSFPSSVVLTIDTAETYDIADDGRVLTVRSASTRSMEEHLIVVMNWFAKLRETLAANRS